MNLFFDVSNAGEITPLEATHLNNLEDDSPNLLWEEFHLGEYRIWLRGGLHYGTGSTAFSINRKIAHMDH